MFPFLPLSSPDLSTFHHFLDRLNDLIQSDAISIDLGNNLLLNFIEIAYAIYTGLKIIHSCEQLLITLTNLAHSI
jgi:hypothetical protein